MVLEVLTVLKEILERDAKRPYFKPSLETLLKWPCGGIGRRAGLKIQYLHGCGSSILPGATIYVAAVWRPSTGGPRQRPALLSMQWHRKIRIYVAAVWRPSTGGPRQRPALLSMQWHRKIRIYFSGEMQYPRPSSSYS